MDPLYKAGQDSIMLIIKDYRKKMKHYSDTKYYIGIGDSDYWSHYVEACDTILGLIKEQREA